MISYILLPVTSDVCCVGGWRANSSTTSSQVDDDHLPFSEMVLKFADKVELCYIYFCVVYCVCLGNWYCSEEHCSN